MNKLIALLAALVAVPALALPSLDPTAHPYIQLVTTDSAVYAPGATGNLLTTLRNGTGSSFTGTVTTNFYLNSALVGTTGAVAVTIPASGIVAAPAASFFFSSTSGERGYRAEVIVKNGGGTTVDTASGSVDYQSTPLRARFPRQCFVSKWDTDIDASALTDSLVAWKCNTIQGYANYYRPEIAPPTNLALWPTLSNLRVSRTTITNVITQAHAKGLPVLFFQATGEAYNTFVSLNTGPKVAWGSFLRACSTARPCTESDMDRSPGIGAGWNSPPQNYGWQADHLDLFNLCDANWRQHLVMNSIKPMLAQFAFDGWQADTLGGPAAANYDYSGKFITTGACLSDFTSYAQEQIGKPVIVNNVSGWESVDTAFTGKQPYLYRETWNYDTPYYPGLNALLSGSPYGLRRYTSRAIVTPGYPERTLSDGCAGGSITTGCTLQINGPLLATAMFAIAGSTWMNHNDDACVVTNVFIEGPQLPCTSVVVDRLLSYKAFEVGYQNILRDAVTDSVEACNITSGGAGSGVGVAGKVYQIGKSKAGFQICHFLNLTGVSSNDWTDLNGTKETPTTLTNLGVKMYYYGVTPVPGTNKLWWASPDYAQGAAQSLTYATGSDSQGLYITFTLPGLSYWSMMVLETSVVDSNLSIDARQPIRGSWFGISSPGVSSPGAFATAACCGRFAGYRSVQFGTTAANGISLLYTATKASTVTIRRDSSTGTIIGTCALPVGVSVTATCTIAATTGLHDVYLQFNQEISLYGFFFTT